MVGLEVDVVLVGDELLDGFVADANGTWLVQRCRELGTPVRELTMVRDDRADIVEAIERCLGRQRPRAILVCGGLGGTWDDITYEAVADALGTGLRYDADLAEPVEYVLEYMQDCGYEMDPDAVACMRRVATIPEPARTWSLRRFLVCTHTDVDGGVAEGGATIVTLPGPPGHLQALVDDVVVPELLAGRGQPTAVAEVAHEYPENILAGALRRISEAHPEVAIGSYPGAEMLVRFRGPSDAVARAARSLRVQLAELDRHPAADRLKETWKRQTATWGAD
jgi:molybdenum cofactor synthesis domain-containing protein